VFAEEGYASASVRDLAARSDLTSGAIYGNFRSKADLLLAAIDSKILDDLAQVPPAGISEIADVLEHIFTSYEDRRQLRALLVEGAVAGRSDVEVRGTLAADQNEKLTEWSEIYRVWQERNEIDAELDIRSVVTMLWAMELGLGVMEAIGVDLPDGPQVGTVVGRFMRGVAPDSPTS
jgi:AcrR family transcriptional regulator